MTIKTKRFLFAMTALILVMDIGIINFLAIKLLDLGEGKVYFFKNDFLNNKKLLFAIFSIISWLFISSLSKFYRVHRYTSVISIIGLIIKQFALFSLIIYAFIGVFRSVDINALLTLRYIAITCVVIASLKILRHYVQKKYRQYISGDSKSVLIIGNTQNSKDFRKLLSSNKELGYEVLGVFSDTLDKDILGNISDGLKAIESNDKIDEIFCAIDELSEDQVNEFVRQAGLQNIELKFIPEGKKHYVKSLKTDYFSYLPILSIEKPELNKEINQFIKRVFDIVFSVLVIVFVISWLIPICAILIKLESKGPVFFRHTRNGINYKEFACYKLRSLRTQHSKEISQVKEGDSRVTNFGKFLRRTSIDELPQFFNVLLGEMSVVGPRPHMLSFTSEYSKKIDKYMFTFRHSVKPGITGLAQIKGYRGEVKKDEDIINRVKFDVFYIENWSVLLDLKIITKTVFNIIRGEQKAY